MDLSWLISAVMGAIGGSAAVLGLARWLGDRWLGRILEKEKAKYARELEGLKAGFAQELEHYRAELDRLTFVTRAHFDTEFTAMKEVSQCLSAVKIAVRKLYPIEIQVPGVIDIDRAKQVAELQSANEKFREKLEEWAVFLEPKLYDEFDHCHAGAEAMQCAPKKEA
jgi:hypothetical protein